MCRRLQRRTYLVDSREQDSCSTEKAAQHVGHDCAVCHCGHHHTHDDQSNCRTLHLCQSPLSHQALDTCIPFSSCHTCLYCLQAKRVLIMTMLSVTVPSTPPKTTTASANQSLSVSRRFLTRNCTCAIKCYHRWHHCCRSKLCVNRVGPCMDVSSSTLACHKLVQCVIAHLLAAHSSAEGRDSDDTAESFLPGIMWHIARE